MVFCKLSKDLKDKLEASESLIETSTTTIKKVVNKHIESNLKFIDNKKKEYSSQIYKKIENVCLNI